MNFSFSLLHLLHEPVLETDFLNHVKLLLAPVEVLLLIGKVCFRDVVGGGVAAQRGHNLVERLNALALDAEVLFDVGLGILNQLAFLFSFTCGTQPRSSMRLVYFSTQSISSA